MIPSANTPTPPPSAPPPDERIAEIRARMDALLKRLPSEPERKES